MDITWKPDNRPPLSSETATVNGDVFKVIMEPESDGHSRPRFRANRIVEDVHDAASHGEKLDLNMIWRRAFSGRYCKEEMLEYYRLIGYTLSGYAEIFAPENLDCSVWCAQCGCYAYVHPIERCKEFVKK